MAKRVNKRLVKILTIIVVIVAGLLAGAFVVVRMKRDPKPYIGEGNRYVSTYLQRNVPAYLRGSWIYELPAPSSQPTVDETGTELSPAEMLEKAAIAYGRAWRYARTDPDIALVIGDVRRLASRYEPKMIGQDVAAWEGALESDPGYKPAHERILDACIELTEMSPRAGEFDRLAEKARRFADRDPGNVRAAAYQDIGVIGAWLAGKATSESVIEERLGSLTKLQEKGPGLVDIPRYIAKANLRLARDRAAADDRVRARALVQRADEALAKAPKELAANPRFLYVQYQILSEIADGYADLLMDPDREAASTQAATTQLVRGAKSAELAERARVSLKAAAEIVRENAARGQTYSRMDAEILTIWAGFSLQTPSEADEAKAALAEVVNRRPFDLAVRLGLARLERFTGNPTKAEQLLADPVEASPDLLGYRASIKPQLEIRRVMELADLQVEAYARSKAAGASQETLKSLQAKIEEGYQRGASVLLEEDWRLLKLKGKMLLLLEGDQQAVREAIAPLQKAYDRLESARQFDQDLAHLLQQAYRMVKQDGQAKAILSSMASKAGSISAIKMLIAMQIRDKEYAQANEYLSLLEKRLPDDPDVMGYRLTMLELQEQQLASPAPAGVDPRVIERLKTERATKHQEIIQKVQSLPEQRPEQRLVKARLLIVGKQAARAEALLGPVSDEELKKADEKDFAASGMLISAYVIQGKQAAAQELADRVVAKAPQNARWRITAAQLRGELDAEAQRKLSEELIAETKDEAEKAIAQYKLLVQEDPKNAAKGLALLMEAEKKDPQSGRLLEVIWEHLLTQKQWDQVEAYTKKLAELNWDQVQGLTYRARLKLRRNDVEGALRDAVEASRQLPYFASTWVLLGDAQLASRDLDSAVTSYSKALDRQPENVLALQGLVQAYQGLGQIARAREYVQRGLRLERSGELFVEMARRLDERSGNVEAVLAVTAQREKELEKDRENVVRWTSLAEDYVQLARLMQKTKPAEAEQNIQKASKLMEEATAKFPDELRPYQLLADLSLLSGKPEQGLALYDKLKAREYWKNRYEPCALQAEYLERLGPDAIGPAEQAWQEALSKSQNAIRVQQGMVAFYGRTGQLDKAANLLTRMAQETKDAVIRRQLADVQIAAGKFVEAEKLLDGMLKENPSDVALLTQLGHLKIKQGDYRAAEESLMQARKLDPEYMPARYYLSQMKISRGDLAEGIAELQAACALNPGNVELRMKLAEAYRRSNQLGDAAKELETALHSNPLRKDLRISLVQCYMQDKRWIPLQRLLDDAKSNPELGDDPIWSRIESNMWAIRGDLQQAYNALVPATKLAPQDPAILKELWDILLKAQGYDEVIKFSEERIQLLQAAVKQRQDAGEQATLSVPWWMHMQRGMARKGQGKLDLAMQEFESGLSAVDRVEDDMAADALVAAMTETMGYEKTIQALSARAKLRWKILLARAYAAQANWSQAAKALDELLGQDYENLSDGQKLSTLRMAGPAYHAAAASVPGAAAKAEQTYLRCLQAMEAWRLDVSWQLETLNNLALLLAERPGSPDPQKAQAYSTKAYEIMRKANSFNPGVVDTHGWVLVLAGQIDPGIELLRSAAGKESLDAWYHLGEAYLKKGDSKAAWSSFNSASDLMKKMKAEKQLVEPGLEARIDAAIKKLAPTMEPAR